MVKALTAAFKGVVDEDQPSLDDEAAGSPHGADGHL
jgi:hypothetical protein